MPVSALLALAVQGEVITTASHWTADHSRIVTEATVRTPTGDVVVSQLGGRADGFGMRVFDGDEPLEPGMRVYLGAHADVDLALRPHLVVDTVRVNGYAPGFVRTGNIRRDAQGNQYFFYLYWAGGCVYVTVDAAGTKEIPGDQEFAVVDAAIAEWNTGVSGCSYFQIVQDSRAEMEVGTDMVNVIKFRDATWCRPATQDDPMRCYSPEAAGLTTAVYIDDPSSERDGEIVDADIEINGTGDLTGGFAISTDGMSMGVGPCLSDLGNTLTHELGHLQGLEHTCRTRADPDREDDQGRPVPLCETTNDSAITEATMFNFAECGETSKTSLTQDDIDGLCTVYPLAMDPGACERVEGTGCCSAASSEPPVGGAVAALGFAFLVLRRRRGILMT